MDRVPVLISATDPVSKTGITTQLRPRPEVEIVCELSTERPPVALVAADEVDDEAVRAVRALKAGGCAGIVLVVTRADAAGVLTATEAGVSGLLRRAEANSDSLVGAVRAAAAGEGMVPPDLLGRLLAQVGQIQRHVLAPRGLTLSGLSEREVRVFKLVAEGHSTNEIARALAYSERTIKNVIQDVMSRFHLRNRAHAVAFVLREGMI